MSTLIWYIERKIFPKESFFRVPLEDYGEYNFSQYITQSYLKTIRELIKSKIKYRILKPNKEIHYPEDSIPIYYASQETLDKIPSSKISSYQTNLRYKVSYANLMKHAIQKKQKSLLLYPNVLMTSIEELYRNPEYFRNILHNDKYVLFNNNSNYEWFTKDDSYPFKLVHKLVEIGKPNSKEIIFASKYIKIQETIRSLVVGNKVVYRCSHMDSMGEICNIIAIPPSKCPYIQNAENQVIDLFKDSEDAPFAYWMELAKVKGNPEYKVSKMLNPFTMGPLGYSSPILVYEVSKHICEV